MDDKSNVLSNNVNGFKSSSSSSKKKKKERIKTFEYFRDKISNKIIIFLQETHSSEDTFNKWWTDFKG